MIKKKGILVVSFGSTYADTREKNITAIEQTLADDFPDYTIYRAFTSKMILAVLKKRDGIHYDTVSEALERMLQDGVTSVIVQPTHIINGIENDDMHAAIASYTARFEAIAVGQPLLSVTADYEAVVDALENAFSDIPSDTAIILMGHGTGHHANAAYPALDYTFKSHHLDHFFLVTVEGYPDFDTLVTHLKKHDFKKIVLTPFMVVAGDHARNDMVGDDDSFLVKLETLGYAVTPLIRGLGEYPAIRQLYSQHAAAAMATSHI